MYYDDAIQIINKHFPSSSCGEYEELRQALNMAIDAMIFMKRFEIKPYYGGCDLSPTHDFTHKGGDNK